MTGRLHENEMAEGRRENAEAAQKRPASRLFSRLRPAIAALAITVGACGTYENEGIPPLTSETGAGGTVSDGGTGGLDAGTGGLDSGIGGSDGGSGGHDGGAGGLDAGTGGMDSGTGGLDSGTGGFDSGTGGMDSGTGGMDSGTGGDGGGVVACAGLGTGTYDGLISTGANKVVGGYTFTYVGPSGGQAMLDIGCSGGVLFNDYLFPEDILTNVIDADHGKQFNVTPHSFSAFNTNITIQVLNYP